MHCRICEDQEISRALDLNSTRFKASLANVWNKANSEKVANNRNENWNNLKLKIPFGTNIWKKNNFVVYQKSYFPTDGKTKFKIFKRFNDFITKNDKNDSKFKDWLRNNCIRLFK